MIIRFPTGLYLDQLPLKSDDVGAFTWVVSTEDPKKPMATLQQIPLIKQLQSAPEAQFDSEKRRKIYGKLLFTITNAHTPQNMSNSIAFEVGRVLTTSDVDIVESLANTSPDDVEVQHDNNKFDLDQAGLSTDDINFVEIQSRAKLAELRSQFNSAKIDLILTQNNIKEYQKLLNEIDSTIDTMNLINGSKDILIKLDLKKISTMNSLSVAQEQEKVLLDLVASIYNDILKVSVLVR